MASSMYTDAHGVRVVTQIIPILSSEPVQCPSETKNKTEVPETPYMTRMFLKGEPVALGTVQIMIGIIMLALAAVTWFTKFLNVEAPICLGLSFILSGSVTLVAQKGNCRPLINSTVALNIVSALMAMTGIGYFCYALTINPSLIACKPALDEYGYYYSFDCGTVTQNLEGIIRGIKGLLLTLSVLEVCVCMTTIVFSCKANLHASETKMPVMVVVQGKGSQEALINKEVASPPAYEP